ncbi:hypothetical protein INT45_007440 [Circinella minor]|uniref:Uncharacterized protein n=1 Tax=Circinella minor TaxID=1195481 RepID=A0A8H7SF47_9FUNG|nr:hypothetical protein INT45_007440 [Circinella minor]
MYVKMECTIILLKELGLVLKDLSHIQLQRHNADNPWGKFLNACANIAFIDDNDEEENRTFRGVSLAEVEARDMDNQVEDNDPVIIITDSDSTNSDNEDIIYLGANKEEEVDIISVIQCFK